MKKVIYNNRTTQHNATQRNATQHNATQRNATQRNTTPTQPQHQFSMAGISVETSTVRIEFLNLKTCETTVPCFKACIVGTSNGTVSMMVPYGCYDSGCRYTNAVIRRINRFNGTRQIDSILNLHRFRTAFSEWNAKSWTSKLFSKKPVYTGNLPLDYTPTTAELNAMNYILSSVHQTTIVACQVKLDDGRVTNNVLAPGTLELLQEWRDYDDCAQERQWGLGQAYPPSRPRHVMDNFSDEP